MSAASGPALPLNGTGPESELKDVLEYEKILKLRDQIFAGSHPRLKVPPGAIRRVTPRSVQTPPLPPPAIKDVSTGPQVPQTNGISQQNANSARANSQLSLSPVATRAPLQKVSSSELDPIFLTKSDTLRNAEFQLKRQRIERALREEVEQKKKKPTSQDDRPDFDVSEVLAKALERVKPVALSDANGNATATDSFDENSLYSSRAPDSTPERPLYRRSSSPRDHRPQLMDIDDYDTDTRAERNQGSRRQLPLEDRNIVDLRQDDPPLKHDSQGRYPVRPRKSPIRYGSPNDTAEEPEYSPPEPDQPSIVNQDTNVGYSGQARPLQRKEINGRPYHAVQRNGSPMSDVRIVRNHITSPVAPQPARVSPLAVAKAPPIPQSQYQQQGYKPQRPHHVQESARTSPELEMSQTRKRRRNQDGNSKGRNGFNKQGPTPRKKARHHNQRIQDSPEPYIKPEPVSPQPFSAVPLAPPKVRQMVDRPAAIDLSSPREVRYVQYPEARDYEVPRQLETRRPVREEQDLRRVASYNARQPVMHQEYVEPLSPAHTGPVRAQSYAIIDRPPPQQPQYYEEEVPTYSRQVIRTARSPSPVLRERYAETEAPLRVMPPPQRRIVMDENGNKYYETTVPPVPRVQQPMAPPSRSSRMESYQEPAPVRQPTVRAASVFEDPQSGRRYISEMPPPQPAYRRVSELADPYQGGGVIERRVYERPEYEQRPMYRSASVQVLDYPPRQPRYVEEPLTPGEGIVRMSSVRPMPVSYDGQAQIIQRVQSVRPDGREVSVLVDEEPRRVREYVQAPVERVPYGYARQPQEERYIEDEMGRRIVMDGPRSGGPRVAQRY